jgi:aquaporin Z
VGRGELIEGTPHAGKIFLGFRHLRPYTPYVIPFLYAVMVPLESHISGTSTNPARTFGPADLGALGRIVDLLGRPDAGVLAAILACGSLARRIEVAKLYHFESDRRRLFHRMAGTTEPRRVRPRSSSTPSSTHVTS